MVEPKIEYKSLKTMELTENEIDLIKTLRDIPYGQVTIFQHAGQPVRIEKGIESITLGKK